MQCKIFIPKSKSQFALKNPVTFQYNESDQVSIDNTSVSRSILAALPASNDPLCTTFFSDEIAAPDLCAALSSDDVLTTRVVMGPFRK